MHRISTRTAALPGAVILIAMLCGSGARAAAEQAPDTDAAVRALWATLDARWNERDAIRFSEVFTNDVSFEFVDRGESLETRAVVREHFGARFPSFAPELRHLTTVRDITTISRDVLAVDGKVEILRDNPGGKPALLRTFAIFAVMMRESEGWKIRMIRIFQLPEADPQ
jgi:uncharacterized protein (TIGR02246 family)